MSNSYDDNDPNWLAIVLCGLHEIDTRRDPLPVVEGPSLQGKLLKRLPPVLDSFARLLIDDDKDQVTAVAFQPTSAEDPSTFVLAQNTAVTAHVVHHILYLVSHLHQVRVLFLGPGNDKRSSPAVLLEQDELQREFQLGEMRAIYHCWKKIKHRFDKDSRDKRFVKLVADVLDGERADQRPGCDGEEKRTLMALQAVPDRQSLRQVGQSIAAVAELLKHKRGRLEGTPGKQTIPDADVPKLIRLRLYCHLIVRLMKEASYLWPLCTEYIRVRCASEKATDDEQDATTQSSRKEKAAMRPFDVTKWLTKLVSVTLDYLEIRSAAVSSTIAGALFDVHDRPPQVICVPNRRSPAKTAVISEEQLKATLVKVGWDDVGDEEYTEVVDNLLRSLNKNVGKASAASVDSVDDSISGTVHPFVHCECALLAHLHDEGINKIVAYIGVSKPSCWLCATYFACYREVTGSVITTRGTHSQLVQWQMPSLKDSRVDTDLRAKMCEKLTEKLKAQAAEVREHHRNLSQTTAASLPGMKEIVLVPGPEAVEGSSGDVATDMYYKRK